MPGKRPRCIQRTTSVSHLGPGNSLLSYSTEQRARVPFLSPCVHANQACGASPQALVNMKDTERTAADPIERKILEETPLSNGQAVGSKESTVATFSHDCCTHPRQNERSQASSKISEGAESKTLVLDDSELELKNGSSLLSSFGKIELGTNQFATPVSFLDACFYCKRRLGLERDIYMYRGDRAFCSVECRYNQMAIDDRKERCTRKEVSAA